MEFNLTATILIVDDDETIIDYTTTYLTTLGFDVISAKESKSAKQIIKNHLPEVVLLDYKLPDDDGVSILREVRHKYPDTYYILFTGGVSTEVAVEAMKAGATDYIAKPFKGQELANKINSVLKLRTAEIMNRRLLKEIESWNKELEKRVQEKAAELSKAYQLIVQSEKMAILGYLATGMAHDIRNPLNTINLFLQILRNELSEDKEKVEYINIISDNANRVNMILEKLLESSMRPKYQIKLQSINEIIRNTISLYEYQAFLQHVEIITDLDPDIPDFKSDYNEMEQLFSNLIMNSFHAIKNGGQITIKTKLDGNRLIIYVRDNGQGIPKENIVKIFEPLFSTKKELKGSGLGLSIVNRIVKSYNGTISAESKEGEFTEFTIWLPFENRKEEFEI